MKITHISCVFSIKFAVLNEHEKTSIQTKQTSVIFYPHFSFLSDKNLQTVGPVSESCPATSQTILRRLHDVVKFVLKQTESVSAYNDF